MFLKNALRILEKSPVFIQWHKLHEHSFLSYCFVTFEGDDASDWQIGWYNQNDSITTFQFSGDVVEVTESDQIFKHPGATVLPLSIALVTLSVENVLEIIETIRVEKYGGVLGMKTILILQNLQDFGTVWNVTLITQQFESLNMKIDAGSGDVKHHAKVSLISPEGARGIVRKGSG